MSDYFVGDEGTAVIVDMEDNISTATDKHIKVLKPGASSSVQWAATLYGDTKLKHITTADDFSVSGTYKIQGWVDIPTPWKGHGDIDEFIVKDHL